MLFRNSTLYPKKPIENNRSLHFQRKFKKQNAILEIAPCTPKNQLKTIALYAFKGSLKQNAILEIAFHVSKSN